MQTSCQQKNSPWCSSISNALVRQHRFQEDNQLLHPDLHLCLVERHRSIVNTAPVPAQVRNLNIGRTSANLVNAASAPVLATKSEHWTSNIKPRQFLVRFGSNKKSKHWTTIKPPPYRTCSVSREKCFNWEQFRITQSSSGERMNNQPTSAVTRSSMPSTLLPPEIAARFPPDTQRRLEAALRRGQRLEDIINPAILARGIRQQ